MEPLSKNLEELVSTLEYWRMCGIDCPLPARRPLATDSAARAPLGATAYQPAPPGAAQPAPPRAAQPAPPGATQPAPPVTARPAPPVTAPPSRVTAGARQSAPVAPARAPSPPTGQNLPLTTPLLSPEQRSQLFAGLTTTVADCTRCQLATTRTKTVFGVGTVTAPIVFVGEAPGADEDRQGEPFVGRAGKLLDNMLAAIHVQRPEIYIANVIKCRPPANRNPLPEEIGACQGYLTQQLETIHPRAIFALGRFAINFLIGECATIGEVRGKVHHWRGVPVIASYHPAFYLRQPTRKRAAWQDLQLLMQVMG